MQSSITDYCVPQNKKKENKEENKKNIALMVEKVRELNNLQSQKSSIRKQIKKLSDLSNNKDVEIETLERRVKRLGKVQK